MLKLLNMSGRWKWLLLLPLPILIWMMLSLSSAQKDHEYALFESKYHETETATAIVAVAASSCTESQIKKAAELIDAIPEVFGAAYKFNGDELEHITNQNGTFDPAILPGVMDEIRDGETGRVDTHRIDEDKRSVSIHYRKIGTYILVTSISRNSIADLMNAPFSTIFYGSILLCVIYLFVIAVAVVQGYVWPLREGCEHRKKVEG